ncbi:glycoside hydrolase family 76 protein [Sphaerosporella brunnea]|uniref:Mannan endo-1,6-alpha-mannosidase n=1 Tax=Sphaerosporella brunnea TaxID=1250544 RepID=A0A5J5EV27_9PEZI|nr:glycoside hydrolase family 76 protein [Sphaerosporella brunnea]
MWFPLGLLWLLALMQYLHLAIGYELDPLDRYSISNVSQRVAYKMMQYYPGNQTGQAPGIFGEPIFWWQSGAVFGGLIDYWYYTGDAGYNNATTEAILFQVGDDRNFMPQNQSHSMGNDDQCFWALTAMSAAEKVFPDPPPDQPQWVALVQAVFNSQVVRWNMENCGGGLNWQVFKFNEGYEYKNTISNGCFFQIAARLARYTGNDTYAVWAEKAWDWVEAVRLINTTTWEVFDGHQTKTNCSKTRQGLDDKRWTYNHGILLAGAAYLYNYSKGADKWKNRINGLLQASDFFFQPPGGPADTMFEAMCEPWRTCNYDQRSFKAYFSRFLALTVNLAPFTAKHIMPKLRNSAIAAAKHCANGDDGNNCGMQWTLNGQWDGMYGVGEQLSALETIQNCLIGGMPSPATQKDRGTSKGDANAGDARKTRGKRTKVTTPQKVGAALATIIIVIIVVCVSAWVAMP